VTTGSLATPSAAWQNRIVGHADVRPADLVPNPRNWRSHPPEQQRALSGALAEVGWVAEVLVNRTTGNVVDGHLRIELALARDEPSIPVTYVELSEDEERLVLASLDPLSAMATAEEEQLASLLEGLEPADDALRALLDELAREYKLDALRTGFVDPDEVPPVPDEPYVQAGDMFVLGVHRLLCGDATSAADVARLLDGAEPTLLATDPPYGVSLDPTWRDGVYNALGPAEPGYLRVDPNIDEDGATRAPGRAHGRTKGHRNTTVSGDTRVDWSDAFALVPSLTSATSGTPGCMPPRSPTGSSGSASRSSARWSGTRASLPSDAPGTTGVMSRAGSSAARGPRAGSSARGTSRRSGGRRVPR
jgi:hypothetical protein